MKVDHVWKTSVDLDLECQLVSFLLCISEGVQWEFTNALEHM